MRDDEGEDEDCEEGQRQDEHVEEAVVPLSNAVPYPGAVMIEPLCAEDQERIYLIFNIRQREFNLIHCSLI